MKFFETAETKTSSDEDLSYLRAMVVSKEAELMKEQSKMSLSDFSTTQLKAELRRRKRERRGYM